MPDYEIYPGYMRGFYSGLDLIANFINTLPTDTMTKKEIRSAVYRKCIDPKYEYGMETVIA